MSYPIKQDLKLPGDIGGLNGSGNAKGFLRVDPEAFHSPLAQNKVTARGGRWIDLHGEDSIHLYTKIKSNLQNKWGVIFNMNQNRD